PKAGTIAVLVADRLGQVSGLFQNACAKRQTSSLQCQSKSTHAGKSRFYWCYLELSLRWPFILGSSAVHLDERGRENKEAPLCRRRSKKAGKDNQTICFSAWISPRI